MQDDAFFSALTARLRDEEGCHTVILYGSQARGDATAESDVDVIAFRDGERPLIRDAGIWRGARMDLFVYPTSRLANADASLIHIRGGRVLLERDGAGHGLLARLEAVHAQGPAPMSADEVAANRAWAWKMLDRAARGDIEGDYRRVWLLTTLLEHHFQLRGDWYPGSKAGLAALAQNDPASLALFEAALKPAAPFEAIAALVERVSGPRQ
ncbi:MAG TPA: nucleotidyltransferase domain-containing protein [Caulobacteraceae bacterium]|jgi:hypothetical protein